MSAFTITFPGTASEFTEKAHTAITAKGGIFVGDTSKGQFHIHTAVGAVEGTYDVLPPTADQQTPIAITITKKPFIVSTNTIKNAISDFF